MNDVLLTSRSASIPESSTSGPIYICTRNDDLEAIIEKTPLNRREDLVFLQNGMLSPYLESKGLLMNTQGPISVIYLYNDTILHKTQFIASKRVLISIIIFLIDPLILKCRLSLLRNFKERGETYRWSDWHQPWGTDLSYRKMGHWFRQ